LFVLLVFLFYYGFWKLSFFDWFIIRNKNNWRFVILREIAECIGFFFLFHSHLKFLELEILSFYLNYLSIFLSYKLDFEILFHK